MRYARIIYNTVDTISIPEPPDPENWISVPDNVFAGYILGEDGQFTPPEPAPDPVVIPDRVTANQFGKQLAALGLMDQVTAWVGQQDAATQWSFNRSATFVRDDPMMQTGFAALGFTTEQIDQFFVDAAKL